MEEEVINEEVQNEKEQGFAQKVLNRAMPTETTENFEEKIKRMLE